MSCRSLWVYTGSCVCVCVCVCVCEAIFMSERPTPCACVTFAGLHKRVCAPVSTCLQHMHESGVSVATVHACVSRACVCIACSSVCMSTHVSQCGCRPCSVKERDLGVSSSADYGERGQRQSTAMSLLTHSHRGHSLVTQGDVLHYLCHNWT